MAFVKIKGHEFKSIIIKDSFYRKSLFFKNCIINSLRKLNVHEDDVRVTLEKVAMKKAPASAAWYLDGYHLYYSYKASNNYAQNLFIVSKIIEFEVNELLGGYITMEEFVRNFTEDHDVEEQRKEARKVLGLPEDTLDLDLIHETYKGLAKKFHPDMPSGDLETFKKINNAHKMLKRELA